MDILKTLISDISEDKVEEVIIGVHSTLVKTAKNAGIASTIKYSHPCDDVDHAGELEQLNLKELAAYALSDKLLEASIGMAAINCYYSDKMGISKIVNAKDIIIEKGKNKTLGIIGHFPFLEKNKGLFRNCYIFEKFPREGDLTENDIVEFLPKADVVAITGTSLTNHSFENILKHLPQRSFNIVLGPTAPMSPCLFDHGIDAISGSVVKDYNLVRQSVIQAVPTRHIKGVEMKTVFKEDYL